MGKKIVKFLEKYESLIFILIGVTILRIPSLFEPNRYADEDIYLTMGMAIRRGLVLYKDIHDNKPPLIYYTAALAGGVMGFRLILLIWNLINVVIVHGLTGWFLKKKWTVILATALFGIFSTVPLLEGNIANGEIFMIMPASLGVLIFLRNIKNSRTLELKKYLVAGGLFAAGFLFKIPVIFDLMALLCWFVIYEAESFKDLLKRLFNRRIWLVVVGFLLPIVLSLVFYFAQGAGETYIKAALGQNVGYVSSWEGGRAPFYQSGMFQRGVVLVVLSLLVFFFRRKMGSRRSLILLWTIFAIFGANLSGRPYPHYLIQVVTPLAILVGLFFESRSTSFYLNSLLVVLVFGGSLFWYKYWYYKSLPYYGNFAEYAVGKNDRDVYWRTFGDGVDQNYRVGRLIKMVTTKEDRIFVWGTEPAIYVISERLPVGRYTVSYHILDFGAQEETLKKLRAETPKVVVMLDYEGARFDELRIFLDEKYVLIDKIGQARVYWRLTKK